MLARLKSVHYAIDFAIGVLLLIGPWLFGFAENVAAVVVTVLFGVAMIANGLCAADQPMLTRIPFVTHLFLEVAGGGLLVGSPWIIGFSHLSWVPHVVIGIVVAARGLLWLVGTAAFAGFSSRKQAFSE
jgi:hypothetical protein